MFGDGQHMLLQLCCGEILLVVRHELGATAQGCGRNKVVRQQVHHHVVCDEPANVSLSFSLNAAYRLLKVDSRDTDRSDLWSINYLITDNRARW
jgi:hypothetical protein